MGKSTEVDFNPVKEMSGGKQAERVVWSTNIINVALQAIEEGKPLKASPFYMKNTKLLKPELVYKRTKEEIEDYLKRVDELGTKLMGEDKETYDWLIYGYNQCAKLLNETEEQCKKQKDNWNKLKEYIRKNIIYDDIGMKILDPSPVEDYIQELEQGSDNNE